MQMRSRKEICRVRTRAYRQTARTLFLAGAFLLAYFASLGQTAGSNQESTREAPVAELPKSSGAKAELAKPCPVKQPAAAAATPATTSAGSTSAGNAPEASSFQPPARQAACPPVMPKTDWFARFIDGPQTRRMTPKEKGWLAMRNVADPFNGLTILASSAITIGSDSHTTYGPGMAGFGRFVGVSYTQDMTGEFIGTFLIPSITHQDPHYHRWPRASMKRRIAHAAYQVLWTQGDNGREMVNYANVLGFAIEGQIGNLYVPGRRTNAPASAERYGIAFLSAPIDNYITEFLPDIARRFHTHVVVIQRFINQVAKTGGPQ
jgi:hypothetical protein